MWRPLEVELDYGEDLHPERLFDGCIADLWKYGSLYPVPLSHSVDLIPFRFVDGIMKAWQRYSTRR
jgi:hypothetical protein